MFIVSGRHVVIAVDVEQSGPKLVEMVWRVRLLRQSMQLLKRYLKILLLVALEEVGAAQIKPRFGRFEALQLLNRCLELGRVELTSLTSR